MKKVFAFIAAFAFVNLSFAQDFSNLKYDPENDEYAEENQKYEGRNGTILKKYRDEDAEHIVRIHRQELTIGNSIPENDLKLYSSPISEEINGEITYGDKAFVSQIYTVSSSKYFWLKVQTAKTTGWLKVEEDDPYKNEKWQIVEYLETEGRKWTCRKLPSYGIIYTKLNIRNKPGTSGTKIIGSIPGNETIVRGTLFTEETDTIDEVTDHWIRISYNGKIGWIFGAYLCIERGGPKYFTPEAIVSCAAGFAI